MSETIKPAPELIAQFPKADVKNFSFMNPSGKTGLSDWDLNKQFKDVAEVRVFKAFNYYETGVHFVGVAQGEALNAYLDEVCAKDDKLVYFSEFDLVEPNSAAQLVDDLTKVANVATTSDGYVFTPQEDGTWGDGDMSWPSVQAIMLENEVTLEFKPKHHRPSPQ